MSGEISAISKASGGCAAKMGPGDLADLLARLSRLSPPSEHHDLLVPAEQGADSGIFRVAPDVAIVQSADFFPPMVSDPAAFGRIAAANALSDVYACGGRPVTAISLLAVPKDEPRDSVAAMLAAAQELVHSTGAVMAGGHTILDPQMKFGLSVTGVIRPDAIVRHNTPRTGDVLVLTKALGTGIVLTAHGKGLASDAVLQAAIASMSALNRGAGELLAEFGASASTDITGFGLIGHALDMLSLGGAGIELDYGALPLLQDAGQLAAAGAVCGGTARNLEFYAGRVDCAGCSEAQRIVLNDAQTSGGLLVTLPPERAGEYCRRVGGSAAVIGRVVAEHPGTITVLCP